MYKWINFVLAFAGLALFLGGIAGGSIMVDGDPNTVAKLTELFSCIGVVAIILFGAGVGIFCLSEFLNSKRK